MKKFPKISIVTPSYNQGQFIEETITSILDQGYPNLEYIIIDGGSKDDTVEIIKKYQNHLKFWVSENDKGQSDAINKGLSHCTGDVFNWLNSDDYYSEMSLFHVADAFSDTFVNVVAGKSRVFGGETEWISEGSVFIDESSSIIRNPRIDQPATFFRMNIVQELGRVNPLFHYTMDLEWLFKYQFKYGSKGIKRIDPILVNFREHPNSKTVSASQLFHRDRTNLYKAIIAFIFPERFQTTLRFDFPSTPIIHRNHIAKVTNHYFYGKLIEFYGARKFDEARDVMSWILVELLDEIDQKEVRKLQKRLSVPEFLFKLRDLVS